MPTSEQHPREVLEGFQRIQWNALTAPQLNTLQKLRRIFSDSGRGEWFFRTTEGFQAAYSVKQIQGGFVHVVSGKSKCLPLDDQIEACLYFLLKLNRQFESAKIEPLLTQSDICQSRFGTLYIEFVLSTQQQASLLSVVTMEQLRPPGTLPLSSGSDGG